MGMLQESKAEKALDALKSMSAPHARVLRDGREQVIDASLLVPGDILKLEAGDFVPADAPAAAQHEPEKRGVGADRRIGSGQEKERRRRRGRESAARRPREYGVLGVQHHLRHGDGRRHRDGDADRDGRIAGLLEGEDEGQTPLQKKLAQLGKYLGIVALFAWRRHFRRGAAFGHRRAGNLYDGGLTGRLRRFPRDCPPS